MLSLEPLAIGLVLLSALMHAGWNLIAKLGNDRLVAVALIKAPNIFIAGAILLLLPFPAPPSWPFLALSVVVNCLYFFFLINAYRAGDLSLAYPVARGIAPLLVLGLSWIAAREIPDAAAVAGVGVVCVSLFALGLERRATQRHYTTLCWAAGVGICIAVYTVGDGLGARASGSPIAYVAALNIVTGIAVCGFTWARRGAAFPAALRVHWRNGLLGGAMMLAGYAIVVYALTLAPMAHVAALRESSVIFAALLGAMVLKEPFGAKRVVASAGVALGIAILVLGR
ncbi:MAG TPA: EamA family transporter [Usitatibacter sp.]|nr:EamA family transporter [Usitatibacter sp.]